MALGIDQTVEYFHHRHQVAETREAIRIERENNIQRFALQTEEFYRFVPKLKTNLAIYQYSVPIPRGEESAREFSWLGLMPYYVDSVWQTAQSSNVLQYMPQSEVRRTGRLYNMLQMVSDDVEDMRKKKYEVTRRMCNNLTPQN